MPTFQTLFLAFLSLLLLNTSVLGQGEVPQAPVEIPDQMEAFKKVQTSASTTQASGVLIDRLVGSLPGVYRNEGQTSLFPHVYEMVPIWEERSTNIHWFYEGMSNAFDTDAPFSQHIISIQENKSGEVVWTTYSCHLLEHHAEVHKDPKQLEYIQKEDLKLVEGCGSVVQELEENHFMFRHKAEKYNTLSKGEKGYTVFEYHFFPQGLAFRPLSFDEKDRLVWGDKRHYYLMQRHTDSQNQDLTIEGKSSP